MDCVNISYDEVPRITSNCSQSMAESYEANQRIPNDTHNELLQLNSEQIPSALNPFSGEEVQFTIGEGANTFNWNSDAELRTAHELETMPMLLKSEGNET